MLTCIMIAGQLMMVNPTNDRAISMTTREIQLVNNGVFEDSWQLTMREKDYHISFDIPTELAEQGIVAVLKDCERQAQK